MNYKYAKELKTLNKDFVKSCIEHELDNLYKSIDSSTEPDEIARYSVISGVLEQRLFDIKRSYRKMAVARDSIDKIGRMIVLD